MKKSLLFLSLLFIILIVSTSTSATGAAPAFTIKLLNPPHPNRPTELAVGESYTFDILVTSDEPFLMAVAMTDAYYPGRGVFWNGSDRVNNNTEALLSLTVTGKASTSELPAVCDWPEPGVCWDEGEAPIAIVAGARFQGGFVISEVFPFSVVVP